MRVEAKYFILEGETPVEASKDAYEMWAEDHKDELNKDYDYKKGGKPGKVYLHFLGDFSGYRQYEGKNFIVSAYIERDPVTNTILHDGIYSTYDEALKVYDNLVEQSKK